MASTLDRGVMLWLKWRWLRQCVHWRRASAGMDEFLYG